MTALQWIVKEAKSIKRKFPKRFSTWREYVAQASAIYASKHKGKSPVGKKKTKKKVVRKKVARKKIVGKVHKRKKISEQSILNKIHRVKHDVDRLDEAQHKHMIGAVNKHTLDKINKTVDNIMKYELLINSINNKLKDKNIFDKDHLRKIKKTYILLMKEEKKHLSELKRHLK